MATSGVVNSDFRILVGDLVSDEVVYAGVEFGNSNKCVLLSEVSGMEVPPIRNNYGDWSGKDGGYMSSQLYGGRILTISGFYWDDFAQCITSKTSSNYSIRELLTNGLVIRKLYPIFIKFMNNDVFYTAGYMTDFKMDYDNYKVGQYQVTFFCPDYALARADIYGDPSSIYRYALLNKESGGGHLVPETTPVLFKTGHMTTNIDYRGLIPCYPKITLVGPSYNPTFINATTNQQFKMGSDDEPFELTQDSILEIDFDKRQVLMNGKSVSYYINELSEWWYLSYGVNKIYYKSGEDSDTSSATIEYRELYQGV